MYVSRLFLVGIAILITAATIGFGQEKTTGRYDGIANARQSVAVDDLKKDQRLELKVRVHLLRSDVPQLNAQITKKDVEALFEGVNRVWGQARITWVVESIVQEPPVDAMEKRFVEWIQGHNTSRSKPGVFSVQDAMKANSILEGIYQKKGRLVDGWNLYVVSNLGPIFGGQYQTTQQSMLFASVGSLDYQVALLSHELGHSLSLPHASEDLTDNLMLKDGPLYPEVCNRMTEKQIDAARNQAALGRPFSVEDRVRRSFTRRDLNRDGVLSRDEFSMSADENGDGVVELFEFEKNQPRRVPKTFLEIDKNRDGFAMEEEIPIFLLRAADANGDRKLDAGEFEQFLKRRTITRPQVQDAAQAEKLLGQRLLGIGMKPTGGKGDGVIVTRTLKGSRGAAAGIKVGDRILKIDGKATDSIPMFRAAVREGGKKQVVEVQRDGEALEFTIEFDR